MKGWLSVALAVVLLASCTSSASLTPSAGVPSAVRRDLLDRATATIVVPLPPIHRAGTPIGGSASLLSSATSSAKVTVGFKTFGPVALNRSNKHCILAATELTCTLVVAATPGTRGQLFVNTFAAGIKPALATGHFPQSAPVTIAPGRNFFNVQIGGIARTLKVVPAIKTLTHGQYALDDVAVRAYDAAGELIRTTDTFNRNGRIFDVLFHFSGFYTGTPRWGSYYYDCCGREPAFPYDGIATGTETISAQAATAPYNQSYLDIPATPAKVAVKSGDTDSALLAFGITDDRYGYGLQTIGQFALPSSSGATPIRQFFPYRIPYDPSSSTYLRSPIYGEDTDGNFWSGNVHLSNSLAVLGTVKLETSRQFAVARDAKGHLYAYESPLDTSTCTLFEYPHRYGSIHPIREIDGVQCGSLLATDAYDHVYVATESGVQEYPATGSGALTPIREMDLPESASTFTKAIGLDVDDAGNVYFAAQAAFDSQPLSRQIVKFARGATNGTAQLGGIQVDGFAVDGRGDIYAVTGPSNNTQIQEFAPGATTAMQTFSNGQSYGLPILLPRYPPVADARHGARHH